jgi:hypothetical protein
MRINLNRRRQAGWIGWVLLFFVVVVAIAVVVVLISLARRPKALNNFDAGEVPIEDVSPNPAGAPPGRGEFDDVPWL